MQDNPRLTKTTITLCVNCINFFVLGALLCHSPQKAKSKFVYCDYDYKEICKRIFCLLFSIRVILDIIDLSISFYYGYSGTFESYLPGVFSALGLMGYSVIPLYYFSIDNPKKKKKFLIFILIYLFITMLSGNRGHQMVCIVGLFIVYLCKNRLTIASFSFLLIFFLIGLHFVDFIYDIRHEGLNAFLQSSSVMKSNSGGNIVLETLGTFGETIYTPYLVLKNYNAINPFWGECFVKSLASIIPDITGSFKDINNEAIFAKMVASGHTIGGSFAGEMYYNFGKTYFIPTIIIGYIYSLMSQKVSNYMRGNQLNKVYLILPICVLLVWWIRDNIGNMVREIVWLYFVFVIIKTFSSKIKNGKSITNS